MATLADLFSQCVRTRPDSIAVSTDHERLSYAALDMRSRRLAARMRKLGVGLDDCVGMYVEPSLDLMVGVWGILLAGAAYLPLSPDYPDDRLRYMIEDAGLKLIFTQPKLAEAIAGLAPPGVQIVTLDDAVGIRPLTKVPAGLRPHHLAYVIYTSGSTGSPKGVMIEHRSIASQMLWLHDTFGLDETRAVLQKTPMSFDAAQWEILATVCGSRVVMGTPGMHRDPAAMIEAINRHRVTALQCVPTVLQALVEMEELRECGSLTQIFSGGEALSKRLAQQCLSALPGCTLTNLYGPTECTINSSAFTVRRDSLAEGPNTISIGRPVAGLEYHILDDDLRPVPPGETGELHIAGVQLARGYLHRPDLTAQRFLDSPFATEGDYSRLYKTGDLAREAPDGTVDFCGRRDNQVKLRGHRVELDEIRLAIESHDWVRSAAVLVREQARTGTQKLIAFVELNPNEAALMDQGDHGAHHQSKQSRLQVRAQLSNRGLRDAAQVRGKPVIDLPGATATTQQRRRAFARKTYRFFDGGDVWTADILRLLSRAPVEVASRGLDTLTLHEFAEILRNFGQHLSDERLLPKYAYASPGSLYATQMYPEIRGIKGLPGGMHYYHPVRHQLVRVAGTLRTASRGIRLHFIGKRNAIEAVYKNNIQEVLEIEAGHMVGLFQEVLPEYGLNIRGAPYTPQAKQRLGCAAEDYYLGTFEVVPHAIPSPEELVDTYVQAHPGGVVDLPAGQYLYRDGELEPISSELVQKAHVIAINQEVYERSGFGITLISRTEREWMSYVDLGRRLQRLQMNDLHLGFMSSGYSSKTGHDLRSATRISSVLKACGRPSGPSYFFLGGRVSEDQVRSEGMNEDVVHMRGPAEMIKDELGNFLPDFMVPGQVVVLDQLPKTANGKIDVQALGKVAQDLSPAADRRFVAPRTETQRRIGELWKRALKRETASIADDFFECGGNSLIAVSLINNINRQLGTSLPLQILFDAPTIELLSSKVDGEAAISSRLIRLRASGAGNPVFCWPGLGGYVMNLRLLAEQADLDQPLYGVQAYGLNEGESPYGSLEEMAANDIDVIRRLQPEGPYTLWGYSFGARVAFEAAYQLEQTGEKVDDLVLIAPGSPGLNSKGNKAYLTILYSVFTGTISDPALAGYLRTAHDDESLLAILGRTYPTVDRALMRRIADVVRLTYGLKDVLADAARKISAPITVFRTSGDERSFLEDCTEITPAMIDLDADHYGVLKAPHINELVRRMRCRM